MLTFEDDLGIKKSDNRWPNVRVLAELIIHNPNSKWFDIKSTNHIENIDDIKSDFDQALKSI